MTDTGVQLVVPEDWALLPPGDGPLTKMVKAKGPTWLVQVKVKKRLISKGIWAKEEDILAAQKELEAKRSAPGYAEKRGRELARKEAKHQDYVEDFYVAVLLICCSSIVRVRIFPHPVRCKGHWRLCRRRVESKRVILSYRTLICPHPVGKFLHRK